MVAVMGVPRIQMRKKFCQRGLEEGTIEKIRERAVDRCGELRKRPPRHKAEKKNSVFGKQKMAQ